MIRSLHLVPLSLSSGEGAPPLSLLDRLSAVTARTLRVSCHVETDGLIVDAHFDEFRNQVWSTAILAQLQDRQPRQDTVLLGVTALDLYVPILTFVFGEAQLKGPCAVISTHRLSDEYYGMPRNEDALLGRLVKEMLHEFGHTQGLRHCSDWRCVMSSAHTVERIDVRAAAYCKDCAGAFR